MGHGPSLRNLQRKILSTTVKAFIDAGVPTDVRGVEWV